MDLTCLIFAHRGACYGLDVAYVREIVWLPELAPIEESPPHFVGIFNLRGRLVPVMDLGLRFGHARQPCQFGDHVIVIEQAIGRDEMLIGVIASELHDVLAIAAQQIEEAQDYLARDQHHLIRAEAKLEQGLAMLLDVDALLRSTPPGTPPSGPLAPTEGGFGPLSADDVQALRRRSFDLAQPLPSRQQGDLQGFAVIRLGGDLFGLGLDVVCGFSPLRGVAPLPCCPPHVVGNMNLRGEILTLIDIRPALGLPLADAAALREVVVVRSGTLLLGLPAEQIVDVVQLAQSDITPLPLASSLSGAACCKGVATVGEHACALLDLHKMLAGLQVAPANHFIARKA